MKMAVSYGACIQASQANSALEPPTKIGRILAHLVSGGSLNRFEAEHLGDHCLNSTIATLANTHGLIIRRQSEKVRNRWGKSCTVTRYSLPPTEEEIARKVLWMLQA